MALSLIFYLRETSKPHVVSISPSAKGSIRQFQESSLNHLEECPQLKILRVDGSLFYGAADHIGNTLDELVENGYKHILIVANGINIIDISGAELLVNYSHKLKDHDGALYICALNKIVRDFINKGDYNQSFGRENIFSNKEIAISEIYKRLDRPTCGNCDVRVFMECNE